MRKERIERRIAEAVEHYIRIYVPHGAVFASVTQVTVDPSLTVARVYLGFLGEGLHKEALLQQVMQHHHGRIKHHVARALSKKLRRIPTEMRFFVDERPSRGVAMDRLLLQL